MTTPILIVLQLVLVNVRSLAELVKELQAKGIKPTCRVKVKLPAFLYTPLMVVSTTISCNHLLSPHTHTHTVNAILQTSLPPSTHTHYSPFRRGCVQSLM